MLRVAIPFGTLVLGKYLDQWLAKQPRLITYLVHASAFQIQGPSPGIVNTHAIVIFNAGRQTAKNVRIGHNILPEHYQLYPAVPHSLNGGDPNGIREIVLPQLVPHEQVTVNYLYFPPLLYNQVHAYTKSDEGFAKEIRVLPVPQVSKFVQVLVWVLILIGVLTLMYVVAELARRVIIQCSI